MPTLDELVDEAIERAIAAPKAVSSGTRSVTQHDPGELQKLRDLARAEEAAERNHRGLRFTQLIPPGGG